MELLRLTPLDRWTLEQACLGTLITGGTGGGKSSGPFQYVLRSFLRAGFGGLFLCAKPEDATKYAKLAVEEGRAADVIQFRIGEHGFNFLTYEANRGGEGHAVIHNLVFLLMQAAEITARNSKQDFFDQAMTQLLGHCLEVVTVATGGVDLTLVREIVRTLPKNRNEVEDADRLRSMQIVAEAARLAPPERKQDIEEARGYFLGEWATLGDKTRSSISITLSVLLDSFHRYPLRDLLLAGSTVTPDDVLAGKIVIVDVNEMSWKIVSKIAGVIWKSSMQRAIERRPGLSGNPDLLRPIFIAADEAQFWASSNDQTFQTTARSARGLSVYATQNLHNFYSEFGASDTSGHSRVKSLLGNLQNRFGCQNLDEDTNLWYANSLGKIKVLQKSRSKSKSVTPPSPGDHSGVPKENITTGENITPHEEYALPPHHFTGLKRGEDAQGKLVDSILISAGKSFIWGPLERAHQWVKLTFERVDSPDQLPTSKLTTHVRITAPRQR
jgi:hypothetical protein